jgi:hypothetical protein
MSSKKSEIEALNWIVCNLVAEEAKLKRGFFHVSTVFDREFFQKP